jgi:hypothetical protein
MIASLPRDNKRQEKPLKYYRTKGHFFLCLYDISTKAVANKITADIIVKFITTVSISWWEPVKRCKFTSTSSSASYAEKEPLLPF